MAPSPTTRVLIALLVAFCVFPMILSSRILTHDESRASRALFHKHGFIFLEEEVPLCKNVAMDGGSSFRWDVAMDGGSSFREVPGGPDPRHHEGPPPLHRNVVMGEGLSFREVPGGPDPHHHEGPPPLRRNVAIGGSSSFREVPGGPDPCHHGGPPPRVPLV
ncbi:hypothetical protein Salat_2529600 [Sesamum alatum]|uniref:Uncharacterized protein n=1 Tax=Sesamum alatum TaxID=300844 RepID=A0AAE1XSA3_9LAMI|nr:hypothetical protein Salat_2529600 [Sesamum alatum]